MTSLQGLVAQTAVFSQEAEEAVLGAVLVNPSAYYGLTLFLKKEHFFLVRHRYIWQAMTNLIERVEPLDYLTLCAEMKAQKTLDEIGGPAYLTQLVNNTPTSLHAEVYGRLVERAAIRRQMLIAADEIKALALDEKKTLEEVATAAETRLQTAIQTDRQHHFVSIAEAATATLDTITRAEHAETPLALPTGWNAVDEVLKGLRKEELIVTAGRPGMGKTSFLAGMGINTARIGARVALFTMEMNTRMITARILSIEAGINSEKLINPQLDPMSPEEKDRLIEAKSRMDKWKLFFDDTVGNAMTPQLLRSKLMRLQGQWGLDLVIVDYLTKMSGGTQFAKMKDNRTQEVGYLARSLKDLARDLRVPVVVAAQLNRNVDDRKDHRPVLSDLRESGEIEQEADVIMFLYRDAVYNENTEFPNVCDVIVAKNRNGRTGCPQLYFEKTLTKFQDGVGRHVDLNEDYVQRKSFVPTITPRQQIESGVLLAQRVIAGYNAKGGRND